MLEETAAHTFEADCEHSKTAWQVAGCGRAKLAHIIITPIEPAMQDNPTQAIEHTWGAIFAVARCVVGCRILVQLLQVGPAASVAQRCRQRDAIH